MEMDVKVDIHIWEDETDTVVRAELFLRGDHFETMGKARRNPDDRPVPVIGEEIAVARALGSLALQVMESANNKIHDFYQPA